MRNMKTGVFIFYLLYFVSWIFNLIQLCMCDFDAPYKEEIIHAVGVFVPYTSFVTMWF